MCAAGRADAQSLPALLKGLELREYTSGTLPPEFSGRTLDAQRLTLADLRGQVVIVNFWATWCLECRPEMPMLERLHRRFAPRGLAVVGVNAREGREGVQRYADELHLTFPLVLDPGGEINRIYGVIGLPTTFLIARDGRAVALAVGPRDWGGAAAATIFQALLDEPRPAGKAR